MYFGKFFCKCKLFAYAEPDFFSRSFPLDPLPLLFPLLSPLSFPFLPLHLSYMSLSSPLLSSSLLSSPLHSPPLLSSPLFTARVLESHTEYYATRRDARSDWPTTGKNSGAVRTCTGRDHTLHLTVACFGYYMYQIEIRCVSITLSSNCKVCKNSALNLSSTIQSVRCVTVIELCNG